MTTQDKNDAITGRRLDRAAAISAFATLLLIGAVVYGRILELNPFSTDNLRLLFWANGASVSMLPRGDPGIYPSWRPLAYMMVWLQYRWLHISHLHLYFVTNLFLWTACAWLVCLMVYRLTHSLAPALLAAAVVLVDPRAVVMVIVMEHNAAMACFLGLLALLVVFDARDRRLTRARWMGLWLLLLASALSKEYGLAFAGAVAVSSLIERRRDTASAAIAAGLAYGLCRMAFAGGGVAPYCREMGYFFELSNVCYDGFHSVAVTHAIYNVGATLVGSVVFGLFDTEGRIGIAPRWVAASAVWLAVMALGASRAPAGMRVALLVVACNAALSFMLYRDRDQVVAVCALGIVVGVGLAAGNAFAERLSRPRLIRGALAAGLLALLAAQAMTTRNIVSFEVADSRHLDPCEAIASEWPVDPAFVRQIKSAYGMPNPDCTPGR